MTEHRADMNISEKHSNTSMMEQKTGMNFTKRLSSTFTKES